MALPGFLKKLINPNAGSTAPTVTDNAVPTDDALPNLSITPKATEATPFPTNYANPLDSMPKTEAPAPVLPSFVQDPRMAGRTIKDEFNLRQSDPNTNIVYREPFGAEKYNYVTNNNTELPHRSWKDALKNIAVGALQGAASRPDNPFGGMIGGAAVGGAGGLISPTAGAEMRFNTLKLPQLLQNRQMAQEQALNEAKIAAENQKAAQESSKAESNYIVDTPNGKMDLRTRQIIPGTAPRVKPSILNLGPGAVAYNSDTGKVDFQNNSQGRGSNQIFKAVKRDPNGQPITLLSNDPRFNQWPDYVAQKGGMTEAQAQAQADKNAAAEDTFNKSEEQFKDAMAAFENAKQDALKRGVKLDAVKDDEDVKSAMDYLKQYYPRRAEVGLGDQKVPYVKERSDYKPVRPARLQGNANGGGQRGRTISATTAMDLLNR